MPWSNNNGGGGNGGSGGGGPWGGGGSGGSGGSGGGGPWGGGGNGRGPQRPGGGGGNGPPDLEDILRRGSDRLRKAMPGGAGGGGGGGSNKLLFGLVAVVLVFGYLLKGFYTVQPDQLAVELRFGKPKDEIIGQGLQFHFWPFETTEIVTTQVNQVNIGSVPSGRSGSSGLMLSGDQNIVDVQFSVFWQINDPGRYLFEVANPDDVIRQVSESAMREIVGRRPAQDIFRDNRTVVAEEVLQTVRRVVDSYNLGVAITSVNIEDAAPPAEVADAFDEVQRAEQDEDRFREEANRDTNRILGEARGEAAQLREEAAAYKNRVVQEATGEAQRFLSVLEEYRKAPEVTRKRLFFESIAPVLADSQKVIVEQGSGGQGGSGVVPYLPLPAIENERQQRLNTNATNSGNTN
ncbi:MAG: FtsH protease activity modulator HflK [Pseudomonadota bacterium]